MIQTTVVESGYHRHVNNGGHSRFGTESYMFTFRLCQHIGRLKMYEHLIQGYLGKSNTLKTENHLVLDNVSNDTNTHNTRTVFFFSVRLLVIRFFHPRHKGQWPPTLKDFYPRSYPLHFNPILILEKESVFPFLMLSAKQGKYWYHFYNVFGMTRSLTGDWTWDLPHSKPAIYH